MSVLFLSLASAFFVGLNNVLLRKSLDYTGKRQAIVLSLFISASILWVAVGFFENFQLLLVPASALFVLAGVLGPGIGRTLNITSIDRIGVSRSIPIVGTAPFFATLFAVVLLGEKYSIPIFIGTVLIVFGVYVVSRKQNGNGKVFDKKDLLIPLAAAVFGGASIAITKQGLLALPSPLLGVAISLTSALIVTSLPLASAHTFSHFHFTKTEVVYPVLVGISMACAFFFNFSALQEGSVALVASVFSTFPLFGVFLSHFLLKEQITSRTWLGAAIIVAGIIVIQVF